MGRYYPFDIFRKVVFAWPFIQKVFNKFHLFIISKIFTILLWNINNLKSLKKSLEYIVKKNRTIQFTKEITQVGPIFGHKINFAVNI